MVTERTALKALLEMESAATTWNRWMKVRSRWWPTWLKHSGRGAKSGMGLSDAHWLSVSNSQSTVRVFSAPPAKGDNGSVHILEEFCKTL